MPFRGRVVRRRRAAVRRPLARKTTRRPYRRGYGRRPKVFNKLTTMTFSKGIQQFQPDRMFIKMRNVLNIQFTGVAGTPNTWSALGNGLHLPVGGVISGANPPSIGNATSILGLGNFLSGGGAFNSAGLYNNYRIHSSSVMLQIVNTSSVNNADAATLQVVPLQADQWGNIGNANVQNLTQFGELPYCKTLTIAGLSMNRATKFRHAMSTARMFGLKYKASLEDSQFDGQQGTNPTSLWYWHILWDPLTTANTQADVVVTLEYWIEFYDRNLLAGTSG